MKKGAIQTAPFFFLIQLIQLIKVKKGESCIRFIE